MSKELHNINNINMSKEAYIIKEVDELQDSRKRKSISGILIFKF